MSDPTIDRAIEQLDGLAKTDPTVAPLARLQIEALRSSADAAWDDAVPELSNERRRDGLPLLHDATLKPDARRVARLLGRLADVARAAAGDEAGRLARAIDDERVDAIVVVAASIEQDGERIQSLADRADVDDGLLAALGQVALFPLLQACGRRAAPLLDAARCEATYCPICAAWPTLAELRGLERTRRLRCGRCGADWGAPPDGCTFCGTREARTQGYLAPEDDRESRRALTCSSCRGYLKAVTTVRPIPPAEIALRDLQTLELDAAAIEQGYGRPETPAFPLRVALEAVRPRALWTPWRR